MRVRPELTSGVLVGKVLPSARQANEVFAELMPMIANDSYAPTSDDLDNLRWIAASLDPRQLMQVVDAAFSTYRYPLTIGDKACYLGAIAGALTRETAQKIANRIDDLQINYLNDSDPIKRQGRSNFLAACLNSMISVPEEIIDVFAAKAFDERYNLMIVLVGQIGSERGGLRDAFGNLTPAQCDRICYGVLAKEADRFGYKLTQQMYLLLPHLSQAARDAVWEKASAAYADIVANEKKFNVAEMRMIFGPSSKHRDDLFKDIPQERPRWMALFPAEEPGAS